MVLRWYTGAIPVTSTKQERRKGYNYLYQFCVFYFFLWVFVKTLILYIEKYYGEVILQKTYIADFLWESKFPTVGSVRVI